MGPYLPCFVFSLCRELLEEKVVLERQLEEIRRELDIARDEQMQFVQQNGRQQAEHTEQVRGQLYLDSCLLLGLILVLGTFHSYL